MHNKKEEIISLKNFFFRFNTPNWTDLLLKSVNFFIFFGLLWFFFRKKIVAALRGIAQGEYKLFFSALNKKKQLEEELKSIYQKLNQKKEEIEERKKSYQDEVEEERKTMELEMEKYLKKIEQKSTSCYAPRIQVIKYFQDLFKNHEPIPES